MPGVALTSIHSCGLSWLLGGLTLISLSRTSLSAILSVALDRGPMSALPVGLVSERWIVSFGSRIESLRIGTVKLLLVWPSAKFNVPLTLVKSAPSVALPAMAE